MIYINEGLINRPSLAVTAVLLNRKVGPLQGSAAIVYVSVTELVLGMAFVKKNLPRARFSSSFFTAVDGQQEGSEWQPHVFSRRLRGLGMSKAV